MSESKEKKPTRNSILFKKWLESTGKSYMDVYKRLNENGITEYNSILSKSGELIENKDIDYIGERDFHGCDNGLRTPAEKNIDCAVGNIQETLFCLDNPDFKINENATHYTIKTDEEISTQKLDLIHIPTGREVEFKVSYCDHINEQYHTAIYRHRDANFANFMRKGRIVIIYFPYLNTVAVFDKRNFKDVEMGVKSGGVKVIVKDKPENGKLWDIVSVFSGLFQNYHMMDYGNSSISEKVIWMNGTK